MLGQPKFKAGVPESGRIKKATCECNIYGLKDITQACTSKISRCQDFPKCCDEECKNNQRISRNCNTQLQKITDATCECNEGRSASFTEACKTKVNNVCGEFFKCCDQECANYKPLTKAICQEKNETIAEA